MTAHSRYQEGCKTSLIWLFLACLVVPAVSQAEDITKLLTGKVDHSTVDPDRVISAATTASDDVKIDRRLRSIFSEIDRLQGLSVSVNGGVVTLGGEVDSAATVDKALQFARQVEGVVEVQNKLTVNLDLQPRLQAVWNKIAVLGQELIAGLPLYLLALSVLVSFWSAGRWVAARQALFRRISPNYFIASLLGQLVQLLFMVLGLVLALVLLDATALLGTILGAAGIIGLAVGFAVRDTVENYIASILLSIRNPFEVNDFVNVDGHAGNVVKLTSRATILLSPDGNHIRIPNSMVFKAVITNFTRHPDRRFEFDVGVDTDQDLVVAQALALRVLGAVTGVLEDPQPLVIVESLGDSNVLLRCFGWVDQREASFSKVRSESLRAVKQAFDQAGIVMPEPGYKVRLFNAGAVAAQVGLVSPGSVSDDHVAPLVQVSEGEEIVTGDVSVDRTIEQKVVAEDEAAGRDNLLSPEVPREL
jgi:small-conductance mechanosensitive channel